MSDEALVRYFENTTRRVVFIYRDPRPFRLFREIKQTYVEKLSELKIRIRDMPIKTVVRLAAKTSSMRRAVDPDFYPEDFVSHCDVAISEIHRRSFKQYTMVPSANKRGEGANYLGFLRRPKF